MSGRRFEVRWARTVLPAALVSLACSSVLGIEEVYEGPDPDQQLGDGGSAGDGGKGGSSTNSSGGESSGGGSSETSNGGSAGTGGLGEGGEGNTAGETTSSGGSGGDGGAGGDGGSTAGTGGSGGTAGSGGSGGAGTGGTGGATSGPIAGRVLNHWLQPVQNVQVMIGEVTELSDANGEFAFSNDVDEVYDVKMVYNYSINNSNGIAAWVYEGVTRRNPTLQVYGGNARVSGNLQYTIDNVTDAGNRVMWTALGGDYGSWDRQGANGVSTSASWWGPAAVTVNAHGLLITEVSNVTTAYHAYDFVEGVEFPETTDPAMWSFDMTDEEISTGTVTFDVTTPTTNDRENHIYMRFPDNAAIRVIEHYGGTVASDNEYLIPDIPNATFTAAAHEGYYFFGEAAVAFETGVEAGDQVSLTIPSPPVLNAPASGVTLDSGTTFNWVAAADTYLWHVESSYYFEDLYVVTTRSQIEMPEFPNGHTLRPNSEHFWRVETHGDQTSVDELTGPEGFANEFSATSGDGVAGPQRTSGTYSISFSRTFTTAP